MANVNRRVLPGFSLTPRLHGLLPERARAAADRGRASSRPARCRSTSSGRAVWTERARAAYALTFGASFVAAIVNLVLGLARRLGAGALRRSRASGSSIRSSTCRSRCRRRSAGLVYASLYVENGWLGPVPGAARASTAPTRGSAIVLVLIFIGLPFVVRTVQPVLEDFDAEVGGGLRVARRDALADVSRT